MSAASKYRRLPGRSQPWYGLVYVLDLLLFLGQNSSVERMRLYLGEDHLLLVRHKFFIENVNRFYFSDIQALTVRRDSRWRVASWLLMAVLLILVSLLLTAYSGGAAVPAQAALLGGAVLCVVLLVWNGLLGPSCTTELHTAVARVHLVNLGRWSTARKVVQELSPRIQAAQQRAAAPGASGGETAEAAAPAPSHERPLLTGLHSDLPALLIPSLPQAAGNGRDTVIFSLLLLACAASSIFDIFLYNNLKNIGDCFLYAAVVAVGAVGYGRIRGTVLPWGLKFTHGAGIGSIIVLYYVTHVVLFGQFFYSLALMEEPPDFDELSTEEIAMPAIRVLSAISTVIYLAFAAAGLVGVWRYRKLAAGGTGETGGTDVSQEPKA